MGGKWRQFPAHTGNWASHWCDAHTFWTPFCFPLPLGWEGQQEPSYYFWLSFLRQPFMAVPWVWPVAAPQTHQASARFMTILTTAIQSAHLCRAQTAGNMSFCKYYTGDLICCGSKEQKRTLLSGPQRRKKDDVRCNVGHRINHAWHLWIINWSYPWELLLFKDGMGE